MTRASSWVIAAVSGAGLLLAAGLFQAVRAEDQASPGSKVEGDAMQKLDRIVERLDRIVGRMGPGGPRPGRPEQQGFGLGAGHDGPPHDGPPHDRPPHDRPRWGGAGQRPEMPPEMRKMIEERMEQGRERMEKAREKFRDLEERVKSLEAEVERLKART